MNPLKIGNFHLALMDDEGHKGQHLVLLHTVSYISLHTISILWYDLRWFWQAKNTIKSTQNLFFFSYTNKYGSDLSKKSIFGPVSPRSTKLQAFKLCAGRESNPGRSESSDSLCKIAKMKPRTQNVSYFFFKANFDSLQFCSPWI